MSLSSNPTLLSLLRTSHVAQSRAVLTAVDGSTFDLIVLGGSVTVDARRAVRRSVTLETLDLDGTLTGAGYNAPLAPFGAEVSVFRGVIDPDAGVMTSETEVLLGTFRITSVDLQVKEDGAVLISIAGEDNAYTISRLLRYKTKTALEIASGTLISDSVSVGAMQKILDNLTGAVVFPRNLPTVTSYLGSYKWFGSDPDEDPWIALTALATCIGYEVYFSNEGVITMSQPPTLTGDPDWTYLQDEENVVLGVSRGLTAEGIYNGVIMSSQSSAAVTGSAYDTDPNSPTNSTSFFGKRPMRIDSPYVRTASQAATAAQRLLSLYIGQPVSWEQVPNPAMDVRDRVRLVESRLNMDVTVVVDAFTIPLDPGGVMSVEGRAA